MSIGTMRCVVINVTDFAVAYEFWSAVTGYEILGPRTRLARDGSATSGPQSRGKYELILINTDTAPIQAEQPTRHQNQSGPHRHHAQRRCRCRHRTDRP